MLRFLKCSYLTRSFDRKIFNYVDRLQSDESILSESPKMHRILRSNNGHFLIGFEEKDIPSIKLPLLRQVLKPFLFHHCSNGLSIRESAKLVVKKVKEIWNRAHIDSREEKHCVDKLENHFKDWKNICKGKSRKTAAQTKRENHFTKQLDSLFDIAHSKALENCKHEEDRLFLIAQREEQHKGTMSGIDIITTRKKKRRAERLEKDAERKRRYQITSQSTEVSNDKCN